MCILASPALGPGVAVERRRVAAPVAAATARAPGRHGVRAAPGGAAHGAARPGDFVGGAWGGAGARGPASDGGGGGVRGQRARAAQGPPHVPPLLLLGEPRPRAPAAPPSRGGGGDKTPRASSASPGSTSPTSSRQRPRPGSPVPRGGGGDKTPLLQQPPSPGLGPGGGVRAWGHPGGANSSTRWMLRRSGSAAGALAGTRGSAASSAQKADMFAFGVLLHWMVLPDAPAPVPGALALPPFLDGNLRCAPRAYPCSGAFASCAVCGGLLLWA